MPGNRSYEIYGLAILAVMTAIPIIFAAWALIDWIKSRILKKPRRRWVTLAAIIINVIALLCAVDAWLIEPQMLTVTRMNAVAPKIAPNTGNLKIVHISDIHFTKHSNFTRRVLTAVSAQKPDIILITGDIHQLGGFDKQQFGEFLTRLCAIAPTYGVTGYDDVEVLRSASKGHLHLIDNAQSAITIRETRLLLSGLSTHPQSADEPDADVLRLILVHCPDDVAYARHLDADWAFAGHTHGGQVRLPFWGAITTASATGKRYEYGRYKVGDTEFFVSRGLGLEPRPAPRVRLLCPPEIVVLTLTKK